jgi:hypothetical protein
MSVTVQLPAYACGDSFHESRMTEIVTSGSMRGE